MNETQAREEICRVGRSLFERGYVHATAGNISVRLEDGFLITPTDACLGFLDPAKLAKLDMQGQQTSGDKASKTIALHRSIYEASQQHQTKLGTATRCIIHTHSTHCVALTLGPFKRELLEPITPYFAMKVGHVPHIPYYRPGAPEAAQAVAQAIATYAEQGQLIRAVMLSRLGPNVWHDSPAQAMATLEELEETAKLVVLGAAPIEPLTESQIDELRMQFNASW
jgi:3-dehydro-4-phosphotetronate decarboxylase